MNDLSAIRNEIDRYRDADAWIVIQRAKYKRFPASELKTPGVAYGDPYQQQEHLGYVSWTKSGLRGILFLVWDQDDSQAASAFRRLAGQAGKLLGETTRPIEWFCGAIHAQLRDTDFATQDGGRWIYEAFPAARRVLDDIGVRRAKHTRKVGSAQDCTEAVIGAFVKHHKYDNGSIGNYEPASWGAIAGLAGVEKGTVTKVLKRSGIFGRERIYQKYKAACRSKDIRTKLKTLRREFADMTILDPQQMDTLREKLTED